MTQSTEQDRAEFLSWISANYADIYSTEEAQMMWYHGHLSALARKEQSARRAQVVPQSEPVAYLWQHCETGRTRVVMPDMVITADANWIVVGPLYLAAAPQPPEE